MSTRGRQIDFNPAGPIAFAVVVTIAARNFDGNLYEAILRRYVNLQPARIRSEAEIRVQI